MKKQTSPLNSPNDDALEVELARLRACHHVHDAARILTDAMPCVEPDYRVAYTTVVGGLTALERHITDLKPKARNRPK